MRIKKFVDEDMIRLMRRVKEELGPEAVIVSTSQSEDGRSELVAAVETDEIEFADGAEPAVYAAANGWTITKLTRRCGQDCWRCAGKRRRPAGRRTTCGF